MFRMKKLLVVSFFALSLSLSACGASPTTSDVNTTKPSPSPSNVIATSVKEVLKYKLPLKIITNMETSKDKDTLFEVKEDGTFNYLVYTTSLDGTTNKEVKTIKLSDENIKSLQDLLKELDFEKLAQKDEKLPEDSPQTLEIRLLESLSIMVNDKETIFDSNARLIKHSDDYKTAFTKVKDKLESFKAKEEIPQITPQATSYTYALPLKITINSECQLGDKTTYEVSEDGTFTYSLNEDLENKEVNKKTLFKEQVNMLQLLFNEVNVAKLAEKDVKIPDDSFMTMECRAIENYNLKVNDKEQVFDMNGRKLTHTEEYTQSLKKIKDKLDEFKK